MTTIRNARPTDAPEIATLIMEAMNPDCCKWFYGPDYTANDFHRLLTQLAGRTDTQYSYLNTLVAEEDGNLAGVLVSYDGALLHELRRPFLECLLRDFNRDFSGIDDETQAGELYLDSLCIKSQFRHRGIASLLLKAGIEKTRQLNLPQAGLLVDYCNPKAEKLYRNLGFELANETTWGGHQMKHLTRKP